MKNKDKKQKAKKVKKQKYRIRLLPPKDRKKFALLPGFWLFAALWIFAMIFTQALRSPLSSVLFVFVSLLPIAEIIELLILYANVSVSSDCDGMRIEKKQGVDYSVTVSNNSLIPLTLADVDMYMPNEGCVRIQKQRVSLSVLPFSDCVKKQKAVFSYRGRYDIGIECVYVYDIFRFFRLKKDTDQFENITVLPRRLPLQFDKQVFSADFNTDSDKSVKGLERSEVSGIREYRQGDNLKNIHWKLSGKTEELQTKEYDMNTGKTVYILADLASHYDTFEKDGAYRDDINELAADSVVEAAIALALRETREGNMCKLIYHNSDIDSATILDLEDMDDFDNALNALATAPLCSEDTRVTSLLALIEETQGVMVGIITSRLDSSMPDDLSSLVSLSDTACGVYYVSPAEGILSEEAKREEADLYKLHHKALTDGGISVAQIVIN